MQTMYDTSCRVALVPSAGTPPTGVLAPWIYVYTLYQEEVGTVDPLWSPRLTLTARRLSRSRMKIRAAILDPGSTNAAAFHGLSSMAQPCLMAVAELTVVTR